MEDSKPLLTLVKSRFVDEATPALEPKEAGLLETLSMLCSFHTAEDMASFLYSEMFQNLIGRRPPFIVFEIGVTSITPKLWSSLRLKMVCSLLMGKRPGLLLTTFTKPRMSKMRHNNSRTGIKLSTLPQEGMTECVQ